MTKNKEAYVFKDRTGWWKIVCAQTNKQVGFLQDTENEALKEAARKGYLVLT